MTRRRASPYGLPVADHEAALALSNSRNHPDIEAALGGIREAVGDAFLVGEVYLPSASWQPYLRHVNVAFAFELLFAPFEGPLLRQALETVHGAAWVMSNHDFGRLASRYGEVNARAASMLLLTLPGAAFVYQGDEIGLTDGPGAEPPYDRAGRDPFRHPMQWEGSPRGGFTSGEPWLPRWTRGCGTWSRSGATRSRCSRSTATSSASVPSSATSV